jgi:hypothetical protein
MGGLGFRGVSQKSTSLWAHELAPGLLQGALGVWESVSVTRGWHEVDVGLDLLEVRETAGAAQAA